MDQVTEGWEAVTVQSYKIRFWIWSYILIHHQYSNIDIKQVFMCHIVSNKTRQVLQRPFLIVRFRKRTKNNIEVFKKRTKE